MGGKICHTFCLINWFCKIIMTGQEIYSTLLGQKTLMKNSRKFHLNLFNIIHHYDMI
jgi:hypothetical protein